MCVCIAPRRKGLTNPVPNLSSRHTITAVGVTVQLQSGVRYSEQVSPLKTLGELYEALTGGKEAAAGAAAGPIVAMDFEDVSGSGEAAAETAALDVVAADGAYPGASGRSCGLRCAFVFQGHSP